ncbi:glycosyltransferase [Xenorhabdus stockiae]|uniref:glycosyltransferase n=1 Tax=Xenorhabdus stockiae TaxID=351614 RepID=UPI0040643400
MNEVMKKDVVISVVLPVFNEEKRLNIVLTSLFNQYDESGELNKDTYEVVIVDNNSTDNSLNVIKKFREANPLLNLYVIEEKQQGVSSARKCGMDFASQRSKERDKKYQLVQRFYILSADADCTVDNQWVYQLIKKMMMDKADLGTCNYFYDPEKFLHRPVLYEQIRKTLLCREFSFSLFGGFPDGKGFAVERDLYDKVGGIEIFYQLHDGAFVQHLSDDWDFGIKVIAYGGKPTYAHYSRVEINSRRVDNLLGEVIIGKAYGADGIITMKDIRPPDENIPYGDLLPEEGKMAWDYSIKDYVPKNIILPLLLNPDLLQKDAIIDFFTAPVAQKLYERIHEIKSTARIIDFKPIHAYKTPSYRLYFEFRQQIFASLRKHVDQSIGYPPELPPCLDAILKQQPDKFINYVYYFCEDRESGTAHNYFANGGVF